MYVGADEFEGQIGHISVSTTMLPYQLQKGAVYM